MAKIIIDSSTNTIEIRFTDIPVCPMCNQSMEERDAYDQEDLEDVDFPPGNWICWECHKSTFSDFKEE